ncbi:hypothetical protein MPSEU_000415800 [Mayamaea pseudoterrestris]|nr:hypothetical protein MPSEU_000415800 [Mayamaea pseudoterrestris]
MTTTSLSNQLNAAAREQEEEENCSIQRSLHCRQSHGLNQIATSPNQKDESRQKLPASGGISMESSSNNGHFAVSTAPLTPPLYESHSSLQSQTEENAFLEELNDSLTLDQIWHSDLLDQAAATANGTANATGNAQSKIAGDEANIPATPVATTKPKRRKQRMTERLDKRSQSAPQLGSDDDEESFDFSEVEWKDHDVAAKSALLGNKLEMISKYAAGDMCGMTSHRSPTTPPSLNSKRLSNQLRARARRQHTKTLYSSDSDLRRRHQGGDDEKLDKSPPSARPKMETNRKKIKLRACDLGLTSLKNMGPAALQEAIAKWKDESGHVGVVKSIKVQKVKDDVADSAAAEQQRRRALEEKLWSSGLEKVPSDERSRARSISSEKTVKRSNSATRSNARRSLLDKLNGKTLKSNQKRNAMSPYGALTKAGLRSVGSLDDSLHGRQLASEMQLKRPERSASEDLVKSAGEIVSEIDQKSKSLLASPRRTSTSDPVKQVGPAVLYSPQLIVAPFEGGDGAISSVTCSKKGMKIRRIKDPPAIPPSPVGASLKLQLPKQLPLAVTDEWNDSQRQRAKSMTESKLKQAVERTPIANTKARLRSKSTGRHEKQPYKVTSVSTATSGRKVKDDVNQEIEELTPRRRSTSNSRLAASSKDGDARRGRSVNGDGIQSSDNKPKRSVSAGRKQAGSTLSEKRDGSVQLMPKKPSTRDADETRGRCETSSKMLRSRGRSAGPAPRASQEPNTFQKNEKKRSKSVVTFNKMDMEDRITAKANKEVLGNRPPTRQAAHFRSDVGDLLRSPFRAVKGAIRRVTTKGKINSDNDAPELPVAVRIDQAPPSKVPQCMDDSNSTDPASGASICEHRRWSDFSQYGDDVKAKLGRAGVSEDMIESLRRMGLIITDIGGDA